MTIHRAKGLEFPVVCVADLGRVPWRAGELLRLGRDGRVGVRLARPGTGEARTRSTTTRWARSSSGRGRRGAAAVLRRADAGAGAADPERAR